MLTGGLVSRKGTVPDLFAVARLWGDVDMYAKCRIALHVSVFVVVILGIDASYAWAQVESAVRGQVVAAADGSAPR